MMTECERVLYSELAYMMALELFGQANPSRHGFWAGTSYSAFETALELLDRLGIADNARQAVNLNDVRVPAITCASEDKPTLLEMLCGGINVWCGEIGVIPTTRCPFIVDCPEYAPLMNYLEATGYLKRVDEQRWQWTDLAHPAMEANSEWLEDGRSTEDVYYGVEKSWESMPVELKRHFLSPESVKPEVLAALVRRTYSGGGWFLEDLNNENAYQSLSFVDSFNLAQKFLHLHCSK